MHKNGQWSVGIWPKNEFCGNKSVEVILQRRVSRFRSPSVILFGVVPVNDPNFHEDITTMKAEALECASTLDAVGAF